MSQAPMSQAPMDPFVIFGLPNQRRLRRNFIKTQSLIFFHGGNTNKNVYPKHWSMNSMIQARR